MEFNQYIKDDNNQETKNTLFALLYQNENDTTTGDLTGSYFYVVVNNDTQFKINAYSLKKLINIISPGALDDKENVADMDIATLIPSIVSMFITSGEKSGNDYTFHIDIQEAWKNLSELLSGFLNNPSSLNDLLQIDISQYLGYADQAVAAIFAGLTYNEIGADGSVTGTKPVDSLKALMVYVDQNIPKCEADLRFKFDDSQYFTGATVEVKYADAGKSELSNSFVLDIPVIAVAGDDYIDVTEDFAIKAEKRKAMEAINILKFQLNGRVEFSDAMEGDFSYNEIWGGDTLEYFWSVNADLNPFVLFSEKGFLIENLEKMGYFDFTIDMPAQGIMPETNILTLHSDFSSGLVYFNLTLPMIKLMGFDQVIPTGISGIFEMEAARDYITRLIDVISGNATTVNEVDNVADISLDEILSLISLDNNGLKITNINDILSNLMESLGLGAEEITLLLQQIVFNGADAVAFKVNDINDETLPGVRYGVCERKDVTDIPSSGLKGFAPSFLIDATLANDIIKTTYDYGEEFYIAFDTGVDVATQLNLDKMMYIKGTAQDGTTQYGKAYYMYSNYNPYLIGKQTVEVTYSMYTGWHVLISGLLPEDIGAIINGLGIPFGGIQTFKIEVEVLAPIEEGAAVVVPHGTNIIGIGENITDILDAYLVYNGKEVKITSDMISCPGAIDSEGKAIATGNYSAKVEYLSATAYVDIVVGGIVFNDVERVHIGDDVHKLLSPKLQTYENGRYVSTSVEFSDGTFLYNGKKVSATTVFKDASSSVIKNDTNLFKQKLTMIYSYELFGVNKTASIDLIIGLDPKNGKLFQSSNYSKTITVHDSINGFIEYETADGLVVSIYYLDMGIMGDAYSGNFMWAWTKGGNPYTAFDLDVLEKCGAPEVTLTDSDGNEVFPDTLGRLTRGQYTLAVKNNNSINAIELSFNVTTIGAAVESASYIVGGSTSLLTSFKTSVNPSARLVYDNGKFYYQNFDDVGIDIKFYTGYGTADEKEVKLLGSGYLDIGEYIAISTFSYKGFTETMTTKVTITPYIKICNEYSYSQTNTFFNYMYMIEGRYFMNNYYFRYYEEAGGYVFRQGSGSNHDSVNYRYIVTDATGKEVELNNGVITEIGEYDFSLYYIANGVEFAPLTVHLTVTEKFTDYEGALPNKITDDLGQGFMLYKGGEVISNRIAYFGEDAGYRFVGADGNAIMEYDVELKLYQQNYNENFEASIKYGQPDAHNAHRIYEDVAYGESYVYYFRIIVDVMHNGMVQSIITDNFKFDKAADSGNLSGVNLYDRFDGTFKNIDFGGVSGASLIYSEERDSYGIMSADGKTFVSLILEIYDESTVYDLYKGRVQNFVMTGQRSFQARLLGEYDGVKFYLGSTGINFNPYIGSGKLNAKIGEELSSSLFIYYNTGMVNAHIAYDKEHGKYVVYDNDNKPISGIETTVLLSSGAKMENGIVLQPGTYKIQIETTLETGNVVYFVISSTVNEFVNCNTFKVGEELSINATLSLADYKATFKFVTGTGWGFYDDITGEKIEAVGVKFYYQENAEAQRVELTLDKNGQIPSDILFSGMYTIALTYEYDGHSRTVEKTTSYTAPKA